MPPHDPILTYLEELHTIRSSGAAVKETSYYGPLANLLNSIGAALKPRVFLPAACLLPTSCKKAMVMRR